MKKVSEVSNANKKSGKATSRRNMLKLMGVSGLMATAGAAGILNNVKQAAAAGTIVAYHNKSQADHDSSYNTLKTQGYRMISLSVYGNPSSPLYAAVWELHPAGAIWEGFSRLTATQYQNEFNTKILQGYQPVILTATGTDFNNVIFAGTFEKRTTPMPVTKHLLTSAPDGKDTDSTTIQFYNTKARNENLVLRWGAIYGTASNPLFAGIWVPNLLNQNWNNDGINDTFDDFQRRYIAQTKHWARPAFVTMSGDHRYLSVFKDDNIGPYIIHHSMDSNQYQAEFDKNKVNGYYPILVQGSGEGSNIRFAAIFAQQQTNVPLKWTITGQSDPNMAPVDNYIFDLMFNKNIKGASLAIAKGGKLVYARGYTLAEADYPITSPTSVFRIGSCSKPLTSIMIHQVMQKDPQNFNGETLIFPYLTNLLPPFYNLANVKVKLDHLLTHTAGYGELNRADETIAKYFHKNLPITKYDRIKYLLDEPMTNPGDIYAYSNLGYSILGVILEKKYPGKSYMQIFNDQIAKPLGLIRAY